MAKLCTSDEHFGHPRIVDLADRPFYDVHDMNNQIVERWNSVVSDTDTVYVLGDFALGKIEESLLFVGYLRGIKILVPGNHDLCWNHFRKPGRGMTPQEWAQRYIDVGFAHVFPSMQVQMGGFAVNLSHFPYTGDHFDGDRFSTARMPDDGRTPILHGHTHCGPEDRVTRSAKGTLQINVGVDAWDFTPVHEDVLADIIRHP